MKSKLKSLLKIWDEKLKQSGFRDIEKRNKKGELTLAAWESHYFQARHEPEIFEIKQDYYYKATQFLHAHKFKSQTDKHIWEMHSNGHGLRVIAQSLISSGMTRANKDYVATIVNRLKAAMREATCKDET